MKKITALIVAFLFSVNTVYAAPSKIISGPSATITPSAFYDGEGFIVFDGTDTVFQFHRQGISHEDPNDDGKIVFEKYTVSTNTWDSTQTTIYTPDAGVSCYQVAGGKIGTKFHVFSACGPSSLVQKNYVVHLVSTNLTGTSWSSEVLTSSVSVNCNVYGNLIPTSNSNVWYLVAYDIPTDGTTSLIKTEDAGATWTVGHSILTTAGYSDETAIAYVGNGDMIGWVRKTSGGYVYQIESTDDGLTFTAPHSIGLGQSTGIKCVNMWYDSSRNAVIGLFGDRNDLKTYTTIAKVQDAMNGTWTTAVQTITETSNTSGKVNIAEIDSTSKKFLLTWFKQNSTSLATYRQILYREFYQRISNN